MRKHAAFGHISRMVAAVLAGCLALACAACGTTQEASFSLAQTGRMKAAVENVIERYGIPGAVVGVWVPGKGTWVEALGKANVGTDTPMRKADRFRIASITKTFTGTVVLQLYQEKRLSLDDPLEKYVPGIPSGAQITIRMLLNHTSGLHEYTDTPDFIETATREPFKKWQPRELVDIAISHPPYFPPGAGFHYSNTNFVLLGMIVEKVTGRSYKSELDSRVLKPLKLKSTYLPSGNSIEGSYASGYWDYDNDGTATDFTELMDPSATWAAGALISNVYDLKDWAKSLATGGRLLNAKTQKERLTFVKTDTPELAWVEYGLAIMDHEGMLGHDGATPGYNSCMFYRPSDGATVIVLTNLYTTGWNNTADKIFWKLGRILFPEMTFPPG